MFRYILVPASGAPADAAVFSTALAVARLSAGHLRFLHVRVDMEQTVLALAGGDLGGASYGGAIDSMQHEVEARQRRAHDSVALFCAREQVSLADAAGLRLAGGASYSTREQAILALRGVVTAPSAGWHVEAGDAPACLAAHARTADLTVLGRARDGDRGALQAMETVLLDSGRPLLIASDSVQKTIGHHIAIAWNNSAEAARAVAVALPLLAGAETVSVIAVQEGSDPKGGNESGNRLRDALRWHNPSTTLRIVPRTNRDPAEALLSVVEADGSDLLVMGGYSHSRMREAMFGGFTRSVLLEAKLPVLMAH